MLDDDAARQSLVHIIAECRAERAAYSINKNPRVPSPACVEVFRRALAGDQDAWIPLMETFKSQLIHWATIDQQLDKEEIIQIAWVSFAKSAPKSTTLVSSDQLGPVLEYMRLCIKTAAIKLLRQESRLSSLDPQLIASGNSFEDQANFSLSMRECIHAFINTCSDEERLVFFLRFEIGMMPQQIAAAHPASFNTANEVSLIVQRLTRRLKKNPCLRDLYGDDDSSRQIDGGAASLAMTMLNSSEKEGSSMQSSCTLGEEVLLEYILGQATAEIRVAVETSPACRAAAEQLAVFIQPLMPVLYRLECPDPSTLVEYQEGLIYGTQHLILHNHIKRCPLCTQEMALLQTMDGIDAPELTERTSWLSRLATKRSAVTFGLRGSRQEYEIDDYSIFLIVREAQSLELSWDLRGEIHRQGQPASHIQHIQLAATSLYEPVVHESTVDTEGGFRFVTLPEATYTLIIQTDPGEIVIPDIRIGGE